MCHHIEREEELSEAEIESLHESDEEDRETVEPVA